MLHRLIVVICAALLAAACQGNAPIDVSGAPVGGKRIALSFDDVPREPGSLYSQDERTDRILQVLSDRGVEQVALFVTTGNLEKWPCGAERIGQYVAAGHVIANHSKSHPNLSGMEASAYLADVDRAQTWLDGRAGMRRWFRYPFLDEGRADKSKRDAVRVGLAERGLLNGYVTVDASDWFYENALNEALAAGETPDMAGLRDLFVESHVQAANAYDVLAREALGRSPAHVLLLHEADVTAMFLPDVIDALRADGWTITPIDEAYADPIGLKAATYDTPSAQGTLTEMVARQAGIPEPRGYVRNNTELAQREFDRRVLQDME